MPLNSADILYLMVVILFIVGLITFLVGIIVLVSRTMNKEIRILATQSNRLAQKGLVDGIAGLVGNASSLLDATNQLVRTAAGIGAFLIFIGLGMIGVSVFILFQLS